MLRWSVFEKHVPWPRLSNMSRGVLLYASKDRYWQMAICTCLMVHKQLKVPVTLITESGHSKAHPFDTVITIPKVGRPARLLAYQLTPYDETLLLDVDYMILNDSFKHVWGSREELLVNHKIRYLNGDEAVPADRYMAHNTTRLYWMTAMYFRKTPYVEKVFQLMRHVKEHWEYYRFLYGFGGRDYRNDFALSIALHTLEGMRDYLGHLPVDYLIFAKHGDRLLDVNWDRMVWLHQDSATMVNTGSLNVHCLDKVELEKHLIKMIWVHE